MNTESPALAPSRLRHRLDVTVRALIAVIGSYALASLVSAVLALSLPLARAEAIIAGGMASFIVFPAVAIWSFIASSALRACVFVITPALALTAAIWILRGAL